MHSLTSSFVLGYHGCYRSVADGLLNGKNFKPSRNTYDWLGTGIYFWEANPNRGLDFIKWKIEQEQSTTKEEPSVVGAIIDMGNCLDLTTKRGIDFVCEGYDSLEKLLKKEKRELPKNRGKDEDNVLRILDCAVINHVHESIKTHNQSAQPDDRLPVIDTVKAILPEGKPAYPGSGFKEKTHTQICVRNHQMIKGVFRVRPEQFS